MPTQEERLGAVESGLKQFQTETVKAYHEMALEVTMMKGLTQDSVKRLINLERTMDERFNNVELRLGGMDQRLGGMDQRLGGMDQQLGGMNQQLGGMNQRLGGMNQRLGGMNQRLGTLEQDMMSRPMQLRLLKLFGDAL